MPSFEPDEVSERILTWVSGNKNEGDSSEIDLASSLYRACLQTMSSLCQQYVASGNPSHGRKTQLVESHARLCLFGDGILHESGLELCLRVENDLRQEIVELLYRLGKTILTGMCSIPTISRASVSIKFEYLCSFPLLSNYLLNRLKTLSRYHEFVPR